MKRLNVFLFMTALFANLVLSLTNTSMDYNIEKIQRNINLQENKNQSLVMKVNELASPENVQLVAQNMGLEYNNNNIVTISE